MAAQNPTNDMINFAIELARGIFRGINFGSIDRSKNEELAITIITNKEFELKHLFKEYEEIVNDNEELKKKFKKLQVKNKKFNNFSFIVIFILLFLVLLCCQCVCSGYRSELMIKCVITIVFTCIIALGFYGFIHSHEDECDHEICKYL